MASLLQSASKYIFYRGLYFRHGCSVRVVIYAQCAYPASTPVFCVCRLHLPTDCTTVSTDVQTTDSNSERSESCVSQSGAQPAHRIDGQLPHAIGTLLGYYGMVFYVLTRFSAGHRQCFIIVPRVNDDSAWRVGVFGADSAECNKWYQQISISTSLNFGTFYGNIHG